MQFALFTPASAEFIMRWMHYLFGIIWIGHLYYFNFTQTPFMGEADAATKSGVQQKLLPRALWWFRWGAMFTFILGWLMIGHKMGGSVEALNTSWGIMILTGGLLGTLMWFNVWFVIWPNQKIVIENATRVAKGESALPEAAGAGARAGIASRMNALMSIPMLFFMASASHLPMSVSGSSPTTYWAAFAVLAAALEFNAIKGKLGPLAKIPHVFHFGIVLSLVLYFMMEMLTK